MPDSSGFAISSTRLPGDRGPLSGVTLLLVEDSRLASEAVRLMCLHSGARLRRADSLGMADRHLATYRPDVALVDLGLPDGSGLELIARLAAMDRPLPVLATSGDDGLRQAALRAGALAFLPKPCASLATFLRAVWSALPGLGGTAPQAGADETVSPDLMAYRDDLAHAAALLEPAVVGPSLGYAARFLAGAACSADDRPLAEAAGALACHLAGGQPDVPGLAKVASMIRDRLVPAGTGVDWSGPA